MIMKMSALLAAVALTAGPLTAQATPITYGVNLSIGTGTLTGSITTDGVQGALGVADVMSWSLTGVDGAFSATATSADSGASALLFGGLLAADPIGLVLNLAGGTGTFDGFTNYGVAPCVHAPYCFGFSFADNPGGAFYQMFFVPFGDTSFADVPQVLGPFGAPVRLASVSAAVPEPATLSLLGLGIAAVGIARRKRKS